jgi:hypothetical protein
MTRPCRAAFLIILAGVASWGDTALAEQGSVAPIVPRIPWLETHFVSDSGVRSGAILVAATADRGCCVIKTSPPRCSFTNRGYCEEKSSQAKVGFAFHTDKSCRDIPACR